MAASALGHAASGSLGTALSTAAVAPLDLITTRLKTQHLDLDDANTTKYTGVLDAFRKILREEGPSALYASAGADISKSILDSFLFFGFYNYLRPRKPTTVLQEIVLGSVAGAASKAITTPLSNVVARKQTLSPDESFIQILRELKKEGGLWAGYSATLVLTLNPSLTFLVNRRLAKRVLPLIEDEGDVPVAWAAFLLAAVSKAFATGVMFPFQAAKTRLQLNVDEDEEKKRRVKGLVGRVLEWLRGTIFGVIVGIVGREGVRALYAGMQGELLKGFFSHGLTMLAKGLVHRLMVKMWAKRGVIKTVR